MEVFKVFILFIVSLIPTLPNSDELANLVKPVFDLYLNIDTFINVQACMICLVCLFIFSNVQLIWGIIMWVVRKIPGVS